MSPLSSFVISECDRALVSVRCQKIRRFPAHKRRSPAARLISGAGPLDLNHIRPEIAQQHRAIGAGERFRQLNYANPVKNAFHAPDYSRAAKSNGPEFKDPPETVAGEL